MYRADTFLLCEGKYCSMRLFDTHCHLQDERIAAKTEAVMERARNAGVVRLLCCGTRESDWEAVKILSVRYKEIVPAFGLHPWFVRERSDKWLERLERTLDEIPGAAVGEIGLDHAIDTRDDKDQALVLSVQLRLARAYGRPVSLHCRKAWGPMMEVLERNGETPEGGAVHSYSGPPDHVSRLEKLNVAISFSGSITHERNRRGRASLAAVSERFMLVETDAPDIPPAGVETGANEPAQCAAIVRKIAALKGTSAEKMGETTFINAARVFLKGEEAIAGLK
jgi:TatD DNase family protein